MSIKYDHQAFEEVNHLCVALRYTC